MGESFSVRPEYIEAIKTKSGHSPEELFDILVALKSPGTDLTAGRIVRRGARGLVKKGLRAMGTSHESVRKIAGTRLNSFISKEIAGLSPEHQIETMKQLCTMERERVMTAIQETLALFPDNNLEKIILMGSICGDEHWPNDVDVYIVMRKKDKQYADLLKREIEEKIQKRFHIKGILDHAEATNLNLDKTIEIK